MYALTHLSLLHIHTHTRLGLTCKKGKCKRKILKKTTSLRKIVRIEGERWKGTVRGGEEKEEYIKAKISKKARNITPKNETYKKEKEEGKDERI